MQRKREREGMSDRECKRMSLNVKVAWRQNERDKQLYNIRKEKDQLFINCLGFMSPSLFVFPLTFSMHLTQCNQFHAIAQNPKQDKEGKKRCASLTGSKCILILYTSCLSTSGWLHSSLVVILQHCVNKEHSLCLLRGYEVILMVIQCVSANTAHSSASNPGPHSH